MFQRLKGAIDSRIAEEQAKAKAAGTPTTGSGSVSRSNSARADPTKRTKPKTKVVDDGARGPDPSEFESAFVIDDDEDTPESTRSTTPLVTDSKGTTMAGRGSPAPAAAPAANGEEVNEKSEVAPKPTTPPPATTATPTELPMEVRQKLRKLEKLESRYQELLRSYRIAHARAVSIEPFEKTLKENTPLVSISEPEALVEYLNQLNLRGDMVMDELKRVTSDRDLYKKKFEEAEREASDAQAELEALKSSEGAKSTESQPEDETEKPTDSKAPADVKSPVSSVFKIFSPKQKATEPEGASEDFFSYDEEIPQLQSELQAKSTEIETLKSEVVVLQKDLDAFKETNEGLSTTVQSLERQVSEASEKSASDSTRQEELKELQGKLDASTKSISELQAKITEKEKEGTDAASSKVAELEKSQVTIDQLKQELKDLQALQDGDKKKIKVLEGIVATLKVKGEAAEAAPAKAEPEKVVAPTPAPAAAESAAPGGAKKKNNKKKKKGGNAGKDVPAVTAEASQEPTETASAAAPSSNLEAEVEKLKAEVASRDVQIEKLQKQQKNAEAMREKIDELEENYLQVGHEHVEAKQKIKELEAEKKALQQKVDALESSISSQIEHQEKAGQAEANLKSMTSDHDELKTKLSTLQSDLGAAEKLASTRYKELTDLRDRERGPEDDEGGASRQDGELRKLEAKERELRADVGSFKKQAGERETEVKTLQSQLTSETSGRVKAEDAARVAGRDLRRVEAEKIELSATGEKAARELGTVRDEVVKLRARVRELEAEVVRVGAESRESLVGSMRDQTAEMGMQLKEAKEAAESLEEELGEGGETMRRLLSDVDERAEAKVREMRERMEAAVEERDRAEEEAATGGRRRAREADELKGRVREVERELKRALEDREELDREAGEVRRRRDEMEGVSARAAGEVREVRAAMEELRTALDGSERQAREAEKGKVDLRRLLEEAGGRYEKLARTLKAREARLAELTGGGSSRGASPAGQAVSDVQYLKTVLLQFFEQRDRKLQQQLVPVLGKLLRFDGNDERKWNAAIAAK
ncbi:Golgin imh1 [Pseudogymnoascus australis]